jgi:crotonobetainyl-CoA:carnitine CoA-transferase CaiB-like acyl-CoA transferase
MAASDRSRCGFVKLIGGPQLSDDDDRFSTDGARLKDRCALNAEIDRARIEYGVYWIDLFNREGIPSGAILTVEGRFKSQQTAACEMLLEMPTRVIGEFLTTGLAVKLAQTPGRSRVRPRQASTRMRCCPRMLFGRMPSLPLVLWHDEVAGIAA